MSEAGFNEIVVQGMTSGNRAIKSARLCLRPFTSEDADEVFAAITPG